MIMQSLRAIVYASVFSVIVLSCHRRHDEVLNRALSLCSTSPSASLQLLDSLDRSGMSSESKAKYALIYTMAQDKSGLDVDDDSLIRVAYDHYINIPHDSLYGNCMYYMGKFHMLCNNREQAVLCFQRAISFSRYIGDDMLLCLALEKLSRLELYRDRAQALRHASEAVEVYEGIGNHSLINRAYYRLNLSECMMFADSLMESLDVCKDALMMAQEVGDSLLLADVYQNMSVIYSHMYMPDSSLVSAKKSCRSRKNESRSCMLTLANAYFEADSLSQAKDIYNYISSGLTDYEKHHVLYQRYHIAYREQSYGEAFALMDSVILGMESLYSKNLAKTEEYYISSMEEQRKNILAEYDVYRHRLIIVCLTVISVAVIAIILYRYILQKKLLCLRLEEEQKLNDLRRRYERERSEREKEILLLEMSNKEKLHEEELRHREQQIKTVRQYLMRKIGVMQKIAKLQSESESRELFTDDDWDEIEIFLESTDDLFVSRLREQFPSIRPKTIRLMMLLRLKMSNKALSSIYFISEKSLKQKLYLYKSKFEISENTSLREFIEAF